YAGKDMLEVYVAARDLNDEPFVFEAYLSSDRIDQDRAAVLPRLLMVTLGSLALFQLAVLPLAVSLARRVDEAQGARARMLRRSLASWHHQRRRLAQELHDGPIQELTAIGYGVSLLSDGPSDPRQNRTISDTLRGSVSRAEESLRSLVMDLTPRSFAGDEMRMALAELVTDLQQKGTHVELQLTVDDTVPEATGGLVYRVVREALRNVEKHAAADHVLVAVRQGDGGLYVRVHDDGVGVAGGDALLRGQGLRLLTGALEDAGGTLYVGQGDPSGTELAAWVPLLDDDLGRP
ncbi:MAG: sensor histidine kinase, partial [Nocardioides sp.]